LKHPHVGSPTIDHIIPLSRGGVDGPVNVQAAHFGCNSRKNNRAAGEQLRLLG
jgi:5-methylcytosine-specific restriction endonuclease McrA